MRYTKEFKLECVRKYKNGEYLQNPGGCKHDTFRNTVRTWVRIYDQLGESGLDHTKPEISNSMKEELFHRIEAGESIQSVAVSIGRQAELISRWYKLYLQKEMDGIKSLKKGMPPKMKKKEETPIDETNSEEQIKALQKRLEELEIENEYLKKLAALVQERKDRQPKKK